MDDNTQRPPIALASDPRFRVGLLSSFFAVAISCIPMASTQAQTESKPSSNFFPLPIRFGMKPNPDLPRRMSQPFNAPEKAETESSSAKPTPRRIPIERNLGKPNHAAFDDSSQSIQPAQHTSSPSVPTRVQNQLPRDGRVVVPGTDSLPPFNLPQFETPGQVTSVEVFDSQGNPIGSELGEGEYYYGSQPAPVQIGQPLPGTLSVPARSADARLNEFIPENNDGQILDGHSILQDKATLSGCDQCGGDCTGVCEDRIDERVRILAHALSDPLNDLWIRADFLQFWMDGQNAPTLITTGQATTPANVAGQIGQAGTRELLGGMLGDEDRAAGRFEIGRYLGDTGLSISGSVLVVEDISSRYSVDGTDFSVLARPYIDITAGGINNGEAADLIHYNNDLRGEISVDTLTQFGGGDALIRALLISQPDRQLEGFFGYRNLHLNDRLTINDQRRFLADINGTLAGTVQSQTDDFLTENDFHGATLGVRSETGHGPWSVSTQFQLGIGVTHSSVALSGSSQTTAPAVGGGTTTTPSANGLLVQPTNMGVREFDELSVSPEIHIALHRQLGYNWDVSIGYQFLYWSRVMRAAEQIDPLLNLANQTGGNFQGTRRPEPIGIYNDVLAHGLTFGVFHQF